MSNKKVKMMSFDTSSTISGIAYWENAVCTKSGILYHAKENDAIIRVENMCNDLISRLKEFNPSIVVIECPPYCNNPATLIMLAEIVGCVKGWAITNYADYVEYPVDRWRKLVADEGEVIPTRSKEAKIWDIEKFKILTGKEPEDDNEADAYLIGQARINEFRQYVL